MSAPFFLPPRAVVAIPARDERALITPCLLALAAQVVPSSGRFGVLVFVNNTRDGTAEVARDLAGRLAIPVRVIEASREGPANAGWARRSAMDAAAEWLEAKAEGHGRPPVILTTDADSMAPPEWLARNLAAIDAGADAVAGTIRLDPADAARLPAALRRRGALEARYERLLTEMTARLDPRPHDPWPRHATDSGASLAVTLAAYRRIGGMPALPLGEDRAFVAALDAAGLRVRHDPAVAVVTSGRLTGRAIGGAADTLRLRGEQPTAPCDERLAPALAVLRRARGKTLSGAVAPRLRPSALPGQILLARTIVYGLRARDVVSRLAGRRAASAETAPSVAGLAAPPPVR